MTVDSQNAAAQIRQLLAQRPGVVEQGNPDAVRALDKRLAALGYVPEKRAAAPVSKSSPPQNRRKPPKSKT